MDLRLATVVIGGSNFFDLAIEENNLVLIEGTEEIAQILSERLRTYRGECFTDLSLGIPYFQTVFQKNTNINVVADLLKDEIVRSPGVIELQSFDMDFDSQIRKLLVNFRARVNGGGIITINQELA